MVVPAGLVDNWRRELNEVFNLDFEVFGSKGDVTDRKSNAFAKHNRLIVSVNTLKRRVRVKKVLEAPPWDLVVFDEAHHLSVYKTGKKTRKTENFKLAESLRPHCRDLLLLSATPHQGDHFRFWMLVRLLDPTLFSDERDMVENRHRLNAAVMRRTKADACAADGSPLFARRVVHTQGFTLSETEMAFYQAFLDYLRDGYNLAATQGKQGRALGFVMTIFQKIAASSFAAVRATLRRRLLMLTVEEAIERDELLDVYGRDRAIEDARDFIREIHSLPDDIYGKAQAEQLLADAKVQLLKKRKEIAAFVQTAESYDDTEIAAVTGEDTVASLISVAVYRGECAMTNDEIARFFNTTRAYIQGNPDLLTKGIENETPIHAASGCLWLMRISEGACSPWTICWFSNTFLRILRLTRQPPHASATASRFRQEIF